MPVVARTRRFRMLVVEGDPAERHSIAVALRDSAEVVEADGAERALHLLAERRGPPLHLVIVQCVLPDSGGPPGSGIDLIRTIRARWPWVWIVALTGGGERDAVILESFRSGARDVLVAPFGLAELRSMVARARRHPWAPGTGEGTWRTDIGLQRVIAFVGAHYAERLVLADVADLALMSPTRFSRMFRTATGTSFSRYVRDLRLTRAQELLTQTSQSITAVALEVGYYDLPHFDKVFRARVGVTPVEYSGSVRSRQPPLPRKEQP